MTGPQCSAATGDADDYEKRIREKVFNSGILTNGEWVYLVGLFQTAREHEDCASGPQPPRERSWTGPGHLEDTGYIDKQERCPTCERTDRQYKLGRERGHHGLCRDAWHADDHLRASQVTRPHGGTSQ